jgi:DNA-binding transcriptional regulator YiaG
MPRNLSKTVWELRQHLGVTQEKFAQRLGTAVVTVARWETSRAPSTHASLQKLYECARAEGLTGDCRYV